MNHFRAMWLLGLSIFLIGSEFVSNSDFLHLETEKTARLSSLELQFPEDEEVDYIHRIQDIAGAQEGWYVLDAGNHRVLHVDEKGVVQRAFGREGEGPGEFTHPVQLHVRTVPTEDEVSHQQEVWVREHSRRISRFTADGRLIEMIPVGGPFCAHKDRLLAASGLGSGHLVDTYDFEGNHLGGFGPIDTLAVEGYTGDMGVAVQSQNSVILECLDDGRTLVTYANRPMVRLFSSSDVLESEWLLQGGILDVLAEERPRMIARSLEESGGQYSDIPISFSSSVARLNDGRVFIPLMSAQLHAVDPASGEQAWYMYQDVLNMGRNEEGIDLWHLGISGNGAMLAADSQRGMIYRVELED